MGKQELDNLVKIQRLKAESSARSEYTGMVVSARKRLVDAQREDLDPDSRFDLAYGAAHRLALAVLACGPGLLRFARNDGAGDTDPALSPALKPYAGPGKSHRDRFLHKTVESGRGRDGRHYDDTTGGDESAHQVSPALLDSAKASVSISIKMRPSEPTRA
jgi:hypothetical protein